MSLLAEQSSVNDKSVRARLIKDQRGYSTTTGTKLELGLDLFHSPAGTPGMHGPAFVRGITASPISLYSPPSPLGERNLMLGSNASAADWHRQLFAWKEVQQSNGGVPTALAFASRSDTEIITPAAEEYAKSLGVYGALILTKEVVHQIISSMRALAVDVKEDYEEDYATICFTIVVHDSVEQVMKFDDTLQETLYERLPAQALPYFSFSYRFE
jgi:hypothetical protein